jgi:hypothetical protein
MLLFSASNTLGQKKTPLTGCCDKKSPAETAPLWMLITVKHMTLLAYLLAQGIGITHPQQAAQWS